MELTRSTIGSSMIAPSSAPGGSFCPTHSLERKVAAEPGSRELNRNKMQDGIAQEELAQEKLEG